MMQFRRRNEEKRELSFDRKQQTNKTNNEAEQVLRIRKLHYRINTGKIGAPAALRACSS